MGEILSSFGVTWAKLIAQVLIFLIVYAVLKKKAFGPVMAMLEERKARITEAEQNLEKTRSELAGAESRSREILSEANASAERIVDEANQIAGVAADKKLAKAGVEAQNLRVKAKEEVDLERQQLLGELKRDFGRMIIEATGKVSGKILTQADQEKINKEATTQVGL